jgi:hypothetical protein
MDSKKHIPPTEDKMKSPHENSIFSFFANFKYKLKQC